ncbi:hypothetical protein [Sulfurifustis variabilis]|uniref:hypothetical protein n=1 Tax=Sulfurifustis variabilis TaxID=1675686 RepID=UPI0011E4D22B|nr:hypothetical protein [Sulfurifustis variabilis]
MNDFAACRTCLRIAEKSRFVRKAALVGVRLGVLSFLALLVAYPELFARPIVAAAIALGAVVVLLVPYFSRPLPYSGDFLIRRSRLDRMLLPFFFLLVVAYATYRLLEVL